MNFFAFVLEFSITLRVGTKRNGKFYILSFSAFSKSILAWNDAKMVLLNFFSIFWEFSITRRVGTEWNETIIIIFSLSRPFLWIFNYSLCRNGTERCFLFSPILHFIKLILAWKEYITVFFNFLNFFAIFNYASCWNET